MKRFQVLCITASLLILSLLTPHSSQAFFDSLFTSKTDLVRESALSIDESYPIGKLFETYQHTGKGTWTSFETERGQTIIQYTAPYLPSLYKEVFLSLSQDAYFKNSKFTEYLETKAPKTNFTSQFILLVNSKSFDLKYMGLGYKNETAPTTPNSHILNYQNIIENKVLNFPVPNSYKRALHYQFKKFLLQEQDITKYSITGHLTPNATKAHSFTSQDYPVVIYSVKNVRFDDLNEKIYGTILITVHDQKWKKINELKLDRESYQATLKRKNITPQIIEEIEIECEMDLTWDRRTLYSFSFMDRVKNGIYFTIKSFTPFAFNTGEGKYSNPLSQTIRDFISPDTGKETKEQQDEKNAQYDTYRINEEGIQGEILLANRETPEGRKIIISTVNPIRFDTCDFEGFCKKSTNSKLICSADGETVEIELINNILRIADYPQLSGCGMNGTVTGDYIKQK